MAWFDDVSLPGATVEGYFGYVSADGPDEDEYPDVRPAGGTVTFTPTTPAARVDGRWIGIEAVTATIFDGQIVMAEEDLRPVRLLATDANIGVADWAWKASFKLTGFTLNSLTFKAPRETTVNLTSDLIPIKSQPYQIIAGASIVDSESDIQSGLIRFLLSDGTYTKWVPGVGAKGDPGEKGDKGSTGAAGTAASLSMGTVTSSSTADAWMTGTSTDRVLNLALPRGERGLKGDTGATGPVGPSVTRTAPGVFTIDMEVST